MVIFVVTHKIMSSYLIQNNLYKILFVGAKNKNSSNEIRDDLGDNISEKNEFFCELTGLYWIWKNSSSDIIGLCHYRRYLSNSFFSKNTKYFLNKKQINNILNIKKYDLILPKKIYFKHKVISYSSSAPSLNDMSYIRKIIYIKYPQYLESFDNVMNGNSLYLYNIFIMKKSYLDKYCEWLFEILFEAEKIIPKEEYIHDSYRKRLFGFVSERLFNVWIMHNHLKIKEYNLINTTYSFVQTVGHAILNFVRKYSILNRKN